MIARYRKASRVGGCLAALLLLLLVVSGWTAAQVEADPESPANAANAQAAPARTQPKQDPLPKALQIAGVCRDADGRLLMEDRVGVEPVLLRAGREQVDIFEIHGALGRGFDHVSVGSLSHPSSSPWYCSAHGPQARGTYASPGSG